MAVQNPFFGKREPETYQPRTPVVPPPMNTATPGTVPPAGTSSPTPSKTTAESAGSKLTVGPNIKLKGVEITDCDTLVVEGTVEATMDSRVIQIAEQGAFHGSADIDIAEIHGEFSGSLTVRQKLVIFSSGKVSGKIRYGKLVVEEGGQLSGDIEMGVGSSIGATRSADTASTASSSNSSNNGSSNSINTSGTISTSVPV